MKNKEKIQTATTKKLASIIVEELSGMCRCCKYYYTPDCKYNEEVNEVNPGACEKGIEEWLEMEVAE